jgi:hypothetical protein
LAPPSEVRILSPPLEACAEISIERLAQRSGSREGGGPGTEPGTPATGRDSYFLNWNVAVWTVLSTSFTESWRHVPAQAFSVFQT